MPGRRGGEGVNGGFVYPKPRMAQKPSIQSPKGTRDFYPQEMLRRRYIEKAWRDTAIRHGFEEIDGPTFEAADLYKVKSGEGILGEMFGVFSGKSPEDVRVVQASGEAPFALRPEFTPTLARMYAARAAQLPKPTKWFWQQNCFRAERPQRGRLREFGQWNVDFIGDESPEADADLISCCVAALESLGLTPADVRVRYSHRTVLSTMLARVGIPESRLPDWFVWIDRYDKLSPEARLAAALALGASEQQIRDVESLWTVVKDPTQGTMAGEELERRGQEQLAEAAVSDAHRAVRTQGAQAVVEMQQFQLALAKRGILQWVDQDFRIVRGLAYYTGMVFEVHEASGAERAIAGGGRYDNLIEMFGGPPTPAVGFGMGDVVLGNILQDRGLLPEGPALLERLSEPGASYRPDVFVISCGTPEAEAQVRPLVAALRRGRLHARHSYKATRNIGKLLQEASAASARRAVIIESATHATVKDLDSREERQGVPLAELSALLATL
jgi:histidyl-tRNA synthetase